MNQQSRQPLPPRSDLQLNRGDHSRIAFRDYHESRTPDSIKMYLATTPSARIDEESIDNEFLFRHRFGFDANLTGRAQVIALKTQFQMTDVEFCSLRRSGQISIKRTEVRIAPDRLVPMVGWFYLLLISLILLPSLLAIAFGSASGWRQNLVFLTLGAIWLAATWLVCKLHINPWRLLKQVGALPVTGTPTA